MVIIHRSASVCQVKFKKMSEKQSYFSKKIGVRTFSPLFALSRITARNAWRTADYDRFDIRIDDLKK